RSRAVSRPRLELHRELTRQFVDANQKSRTLDLGIAQRKAWVHARSFVTDIRQPGVAEQSIFLVNAFQQHRAQSATGEFLNTVQIDFGFRQREIESLEHLPGD